MRRHRWLTNLLVLSTLLASAGSAWAQGMGPMGPAMGPPQPPSYGGNPAADFSGLGPAAGAYPSYYQPWPSVSPYNQEFNQIANRGGLWESESRSRVGLPARWRFRTEYVRIRAESGRDLIGNPIAPTYRQQIIPTLQAVGGGGGGGGGLDDYADALEGINNDGVGFRLFDPISAADIEKPELQGTRLTLESENADGSGLEFWGLWAADNDTVFDARKNLIDPSRGTETAFLLEILDDPNLQTGATTPLPGQPDVDETLQNNLLNLVGIPLDDGNITILSDGTTFGGASAVYDLDFRAGTEIDIYGSGLKWKGTSIYGTDTIRIRPNAGMRYMVIREHFGMFGRDSGVLYSTEDNTILPDVKTHSVPNGFDDDMDGIVDNAGTIEDNLQGGGGGGGGGGDDGTFFFVNDPNIYPITSTLNNNVDSHLVGPELGLTYDIGGGRRFRFGGSTNFGLLANYHRIQMSGDNIFVTTRQSNLIQPSQTNARPNAFSSEASHTSVSPMIEQSLYAEGPLFQYVPMLRRSAILRNANFRLGYTLTWIAELTRASDSILWQGNPAEGIFPEIQTSRSTWRAQSWNFGISWSW